MLFGLNLTKLMVVIAVAFLLFGVPLLSFIVTLFERRKKRRARRRRPSSLN